MIGFEVPRLREPSLFFFLTEKRVSSVMPFEISMFEYIQGLCLIALRWLSYVSICESLQYSCDSGEPSYVNGYAEFTILFAYVNIRPILCGHNK